jgi:rod shape-determining protein MreC
MGRINLIAVILFLASVAMVFTMKSGTSRHLQEMVLSWFGPFMEVGGSVEERIDEIGKPVRQPAEIEEENQRLFTEVAELRIYRQEVEKMRLENEEFRRLFAYKASSPFELIPAKMVKRTAATWWSSIVIDKGHGDGVATDAPVLTDVGLVGKTTQVTEHRSVVILLTDEQCRVAARVEGTFERGILMGQRGDVDLSPNLTLRYLSRDAASRIPANSKVYSSGDGNLFPAGFLLGEVQFVRQADIYSEAEVRPSVDFANIRHVFVMKIDPEAP